MNLYVYVLYMCDKELCHISQNVGEFFGICFFSLPVLLSSSLPRILAWGTGLCNQRPVVGKLIQPTPKPVNQPVKANALLWSPPSFPYRHSCFLKGSSTDFTPHTPMFLCTSLGILLDFTGLHRDWSSLLTCLASVSIFRLAEVFRNAWGLHLGEDCQFQEG